MAEVVSTASLFGLLASAADGGTARETLLDPGFREQRPCAVAEHFHSPHTAGLLPEYRGDRLAAVGRRWKVVQTPSGVKLFDLERDPAEQQPEPIDAREIETWLRRDGLSQSAAAGIGTRMRGASQLRRAA